MDVKKGKVSTKIVKQAPKRQTKTKAIQKPAKKATTSAKKTPKAVAAKKSAAVK